MVYRLAALLSLLLVGCATPNVWNSERLATWSAQDWAEKLDHKVSDFSQNDLVNIVILGDSGKPDGLSKIAPHVESECRKERCDFALLLGDNFYLFGPSSPSHPHFQSRFYTPFRDHLPEGFDVWAVPGNHGYWGIPPFRRGNPIAQLEHTYLRTSTDGPDWLMPAHWYQITKLPSWLTIVGFDSEFVINPKHFDGDEKLFKRELKDYIQQVSDRFSAKSGWRVLFGHHPLLTTGEHSQDTDELQPLRHTFEGRQDFQIYFAGHDHDQQVIQTASFIQIVEGAASKQRKNSWPNDQRETTYNQSVSTDPYWRKLAPTVGYCSERGFGIAKFSATTFEFKMLAVSGKGELHHAATWSWHLDENSVPVRTDAKVDYDIKNCCPDSNK